MAIKKRYIRRYFVLPSSLLILNVIEDLLIYKMQLSIKDPFILTATIIVLFVLGFSLVGFVVAPSVELLLDKSYTKGRGFSGTIKTSISLAVGMGVIYWVYYKIYIEGVASLAKMIPFFLSPPTL
jgi:hypothetical protein